MSDEVGVWVKHYNRNTVFTKSYAFSLRVFQLYQTLTKKGLFDIGRQTLRAGTAIGANIMEASAAYSRKDFFHKMSIASKEARETLYWLSLLHDSGALPPDFKRLPQEAEELVKMLTAIIKSGRKNP